MDCSPPGSSAHGILQARTLEWVSVPSSRGSFWSRSPKLKADSLLSEPPRNAYISQLFIYQPHSNHSVPSILHYLFMAFTTIWNFISYIFACFLSASFHGYKLMRMETILFATICQHSKQCHSQRKHKQALFFFSNKNMNLLNEWKFVIGWFSRVSSFTAYRWKSF